jgi:hypothetical protein
MDNKEIKKINFTISSDEDIRNSTSLERMSNFISLFKIVEPMLEIKSCKNLLLKETIDPKAISELIKEELNKI